MIPTEARHLIASTDASTTAREPDAPAAQAPAPRTTSATPIDRSRRPSRPLRVTIIAANTFEFDSRFLRSATSLSEDGHEVTVVAWRGPGLPSEEGLAAGARLVRIDMPPPIVDVMRPLPRGMREGVARALGLDPTATVLPPDAPQGLDRLRHPVRRSMEIAEAVRRLGTWTEMVLDAAPNTEVFHCQALIALPVARDAARRAGARYVYDVADYLPEAERIARMPWVVRESVRRRERAWVQDAAGFLAVSDPVADLVAREWRIERPGILLNCPPTWRPDEPAPPDSDLLREATGIGGGRPIVLFQGAFGIDRGLEELLVAVRDPALRDLDAAAVFMGYGRLQERLDAAAHDDPGRIFVLPAQPPDRLLEWTASADVSFVGQPPRTLNHKMNLPNKLFESIMAGVPVVVSAGNEQCRLVTEERLGTCADIDDPSAIALSLAALLGASEDERAALRAHCRSVALGRYSWDLNAGALVDLYRRLADGP